MENEHIEPSDRIRMKRRDKGSRRRENAGREDLDARVRAVRSARPYSGKRPARRRKSSRKKTAPGRPLLMVLLLGAVLYGVYWIFGAAFGEEAPEATETVIVEEGDTLDNVADKLEERGVVGSSTLFKLGAQVEGADTELKPGEYRLERDASAEEILATLSSEEQDVSTYAVTIPEGLTVRQTAEAISTGSGIPAGEVEAVAKKTDYAYAFLEDPAVKSTEGFLFPKRYEFEKGTGADGIVDRLLEQYLIETEGLDFAGAQERLGLTEYQLVTVASLVEKESANSEERSIIASVIYNRIRADMPLQIDATVHYAIGEPKAELSLEDLQIQSPYNTYENVGLPPGPIASPSRESLEAALNPAQTGHLYYVLEADGKQHFFTDDYEEFLDAKRAAGR